MPFKSSKLIKPSNYSLALAAVLSSLLLGGCGEPANPRIMCHNSNCVEPANPDEDDTPASLEASLALAEESPPVIDGVEFDTFYSSEQARCLFAHDLGGGTDVPDASFAARTIASFLERHQGAPPTRSGLPFAVAMELKGHVGLEKGQKHTPAERRAHALCALEAGRIIADAGAPVELTFMSFEPALLRTLSGLDAYKELAAREGVTTHLGAIIGIPPPLDSQSQPLERFTDDIGVDYLTAHPHWLKLGAKRSAETRGWTLGLWMFSIVPETLDAILEYRPDWVTTSEARALTSWLDQR